MTISYSERFQQPDVVESYEAKEYAAGSYSTLIWQIQRPVVEKILIDLKPSHLLDFACGTGRVLACVEPLAKTVDGIDISENMVAVARKRCQRARLQVGDILANPELLQGKYDAITCFRLLLNLEPALRGRILGELRKVIQMPGGRLMVNVHGNSHSLRHPVIWWRRRQGADKSTDTMFNEMSPLETEKLLWECGFKIERKVGFGMVPPGFYRTPLRRLAMAIDRFFAGSNVWTKWSVDILYVCSPR